MDIVLWDATLNVCLLMVWLTLRPSTGRHVFSSLWVPFFGLHDETSQKES
jgi:hypothetical protein